MTRRLLILLFLTYITINLSGEKSKNIVILPFTNQSGIEIDYFSDLIMDSVFCFLKQVPDYNAVLPEELITYYNNNNYRELIAHDKNVLFDLGEVFTADFIVIGDYYEKDGFLIIEFEVLNAHDRKTVYRISRFEKMDLVMFDAIEKIAAFMVEDFTGIPLTYGVLEISTDEMCSLYVDNEEYGKTPAKIELTAGTHELSLYYIHKKEKRLVLNKSITIIKDERLPLDIKIKSSINVLCSAGFLWGYAGNSPLMNLPHAFDDLLPGQYRLKLFVMEKAGDAMLPYYNKKITLNFNENKTIDLSAISYKKRYGLSVIPGAGQIYNKQYVKAAFIVPLFSLGVLSAAFSPLITYFYRELVYLPAAKSWNDSRGDSGYTREQVESFGFISDSLLFSFLTGGVCLSIFMWIYSLIDTIINMNYLDNVFNQDRKKSGLKVRFDVTIS